MPAQEHAPAPVPPRGEGSPRVAVVGSANIDLVARVARHGVPGETVMALEYSEVVGGKGLNQAVGAAKQSRAYLVGAVGDDPFGLLIRSHASAWTVDVTRLETVGGPSGRAFVTVNADGENSIVVAALANSLVSAAQVAAALDRIQPTLVLAQLELPADAVGAAATWCRDNARRFVFNPSPMAAIARELSSGADPLIANLEEARQLCELLGLVWKGGILDLARVLAGAVPSVVVTGGAAGAAYASGDGSGLVPARAVKVQDTTGAGDEFAGALAAALGGGEPLSAAVAHAAEAASALVATPRAARRLGPGRVRVR